MPRKFSRKEQRQAIDDEIKSLEESIRALRQRRNALAPVSSLPTEIFAAIFSFLRVPVASSLITLGERPDQYLAWLRVVHVCHHWREIALNQPHFWSHVHFAIFSSPGVAEILARAKTVPLYLEARVPTDCWDKPQFSALTNELHVHVSHICHLAIRAECFGLRTTLEGLASRAARAPTLEYLSLSCEESRHTRTQLRVSVPDTLFDGSAPRLSCLELQNCNISWKSPLLKGLRYLDIRTPAVNVRPSLSVWLDALDKMPQLKTLTLHMASPIAPRRSSLPSDDEDTVTLPSLTHLDISASARDCEVALAHLDLPALTQLRVTVSVTIRSFMFDDDDVRDILPYVVQNAYGPQDARPLQSMVVHSDKVSADVLAWSLPYIDVKLPNLLPNPIIALDTTLPARVAFSLMKEHVSPGDHTRAFDSVLAALPLGGLVSITSQSRISPLNKQSWLRYAPGWRLLRRVCLGPSAASGFREMLLEDNGGRLRPLLPSLRKLVLVNTRFSARRTLRLCDALMQRVEQGVPLETLDLRTCIATSFAVELLSEIVVDVLGPEGDREREAQILSVWDFAGRGAFIEDEGSGLEDYDDDDSDTGSDDEVRGPWDEDDGEGDGYW